METLIILLVFLLFAVAVLGIFLPLLPGVPIAWFGLLLYGLATDFRDFSITKLLVFLGLTVFTIIVDITAPVLGAKKYNASGYGAIGSFIGVIVGVFMLGPAGIILGPLVGVFLGEIIAGKEPSHAIHAAWGSLAGFLAGSAIKLVVIAIMFGFFVASLF